MNIQNYSCKYFGTSKVLNSYLNDIRKYAVPTVEEEENLIIMIKDGNRKAREEMIMRNQRFVYSLAKIYARDENEVIDYVNEGNIGLMEAFDSFDPSKGFRFMTHAVWYIRRQMNYYLNNISSIVNRTNNMKYGKKIERIRQKFMAENGYAPTNEEVIEIMKSVYGDSVKDVRDVYDVNVSSISDEIDDDFCVEDNSEFNKATASCNTYEFAIENDYFRELLEDVLSNIPKRQADIIRRLYGIGYERCQSLDEVGIIYDLMASDVNDIRNNVLKYLKQHNTGFSNAV